MKQFKNLLLCMTVALLGMSLTSCEDDEYIAHSVEGVWQGEVATAYFNYRYGPSYDYQQVRFTFMRNSYYSTCGTGKEVDYNGYGRYSTTYYFDWQVRNNCIYLNYRDGSPTVRIDRYHVNHDIFEGEFRNGRTGNKLADFRLNKVIDL